MAVAINPAEVPPDPTADDLAEWTMWALHYEAWAEIYHDIGETRESYEASERAFEFEQAIQSWGTER